MPLYEYRKNAENHVLVPEKVRQNYLCGTEKVCDRILQILQEKKGAGPMVAALDGWYGVNWNALADALGAAATRAKLRIRIERTSALFRSREEILDYRKPFLTEDPSFGWVNAHGTLADIMDQTRVEKLVRNLESIHGSQGEADIILILGYGAAVEPIAEQCKATFYFDFTMQPLLWEMWGGRLTGFGSDSPEPNYIWKSYYYCDFYLLLKQKKAVFPRMDYFVEAVDASNLKLLPAADYNAVIDELVQQPIKQVKIAQPGPWGAYRFKELYDDIPGLECMAWNELAGIELSILVDLGGPAMLNIPCQNIMQRPVQMVGSHIHETYPDLLPLQVWLDDGYFKEPVTYERASMPIHNHPDTDYVRRNFNEPFGRYETYYIVEAYPDAGTMMGFKEQADLEKYERLCRDSNNQKEIDWQEFVCRWPTNVGDLFLIPPGTEHGHGGNQMILEMDTGPSVAGTEYSFFTYDFARPTWDDEKKSMTAPRMKMHLEHSFRNNKWRRENYVRENLRARPVVVAGDGDTRLDRFTTISEMPFEIERFVFSKPMAHSTEGRFLQIPTLTVGRSVIIRSKTDPSKQVTLEYLQACLIPAGFGDYEFESADGMPCTVVMIRLKKA